MSIRITTGQAEASLTGDYDARAQRVDELEQSGRYLHRPNAWAWFFDALIAKVDPGAPTPFSQGAGPGENDPGDLDGAQCVALADMLTGVDTVSLEMAARATWIPRNEQPGQEELSWLHREVGQVADLLRFAAVEGGLIVR